jgi:hypothetical protein
LRDMGRAAGSSMIPLRPFSSNRSLSEYVEI